MTEEACERQKIGMTDNCVLCKEVNNKLYKRCKIKNR